MLKAILFDVDGTLADTEDAHLQAFNQAFAELNLRWHWTRDLYTDLLGVTGGKERLRHYWQYYEASDYERHTELSVQQRIDLIHTWKNRFYAQRVEQGAVGLRPGIRDLILEASAQGILLGITTTTSPVNIDRLLTEAFDPDWARFFAVIEDGVSAPNKKPDPQVYLQALRHLRLSPDECLVIEDSEKGLLAAWRAGLRCVITPTDFTAKHDFHRAWLVLDDLSDSVQQLQSWQSLFAEPEGRLACQ